VVHGNAHDEGAIGCKCVHRIESATETDFEHGYIHPRLDEEPHRRERAELEIGELDLAARDLDRRQRACEIVVGCFGAPDANTLVVAKEVRRGIAAGAISGVVENRFEHRARRAFAVGAADGEDGEIGRKTHRVAHGRDALEPHFDRARMNALDVREPLCKSHLGPARRDGACP
jgi:hypothetical protein